MHRTKNDSPRLSSTESESKGAKARWPKRFLLIGVMGGVAVSVAANLVPRPAPELNSNIASTFNADGMIQTIGRVDAEFEKAIVAKQLDACPPADWLTLCRRLNLSLVGSGLSLEDVRLLEQIPEAERVRWWTDHLLEDPRSSDYLSERFTRAFVGTNKGPFIVYRRRKFQLWLAEQIKNNVPYDAIVRELIAAEGLWTNNPAVNFLTATMDENDNGKADPVRLAGRTSRAFLGMRIDCLQCHDDFLGNVQLGSPLKPSDGKQQNFHELAAFFSAAGFPEKNPFGGLRDRPRDYLFKYLHDEKETNVQPQVPFQADLLTEEGSARSRLANWVTHRENKPFARAAVNRVWALLFGKPLVSPVDDIPIAGPYPPGLELLADDFSQHGYSLHRLIRIVSQLQVFQRESQSSEFEPTELHETMWASFPLTQLRPEQVAASIHQACRLKTVDDNSSITSQLEKYLYVNDFIRDYGDRGEDEFNGQSVTIPQRLLMMNGGLIGNRTENNPLFNATTRIGALAASDAQAIQAAYLATLNRLPSAEEEQALASHLDGKKGDDRMRSVADIYWMLLNSTEFLWNH